MFKKIFLILFFLIFVSCGFTPVYDNLANQNLSIKSIMFDDGDRELSILLKRNLERYKTNNSRNLFSISGDIEYEKNIISKDTKGVATKYQLIALANIKVEKNDKINSFSFKETFTIENTNDDFANKRYEQTIKKNFANTITEQLITKIILIE